MAISRPQKRVCLLSIVQELVCYPLYKKECDVFIMNIENYFKFGRDRDFDVKKGGTVGLTRKNRWDGGILEPYCGPSYFVGTAASPHYSSQTSYRVTPIIKTAKSECARVTLVCI